MNKYYSLLIVNITVVTSKDDNQKEPVTHWSYNGRTPRGMTGTLSPPTTVAITSHIPHSGQNIPADTRKQPQLYNNNLNPSAIIKEHNKMPPMPSTDTG